MNNLPEAISLLREEVGKQIDVEQHAVTYLTNIFLDTYSHDGVEDDEDPTPSLIHDVDLDTLQRVLLIVAGCALSFQQQSEQAFEEDAEERPEMSELDKARWTGYLDGVITLTSGLMGLALNVSDSATAEGELTVEDIIGGAEHGE
jgi:hypothetical protein